MRILAPILLALSSGLLAACGAHQAPQTTTLPPEYTQPVFIESLQGNSVLVTNLPMQVRSSGMRVADLRTETNTVLRISREQLDRRMLSGGSGSGGASQYELRYSVTYVVTRDARELFDPVTLTRTTIYTPDGRGGPANNQETDMLGQALAREVVRDMKRRMGIR
jgi:outer membrane lipopolysaccharide assembly protein LptE/RlpB